MEKENEHGEEINNNNQEQQNEIPFSLKGEINLVNDEEEQNKDVPAQKERLEKMLNKLRKKYNENEENNEKKNQQEKVVLRGVKKVIKSAAPAKLNIKK